MEPSKESALLGLPLEREAFVWAVGSLCQIHRVPFDPRLLLQQFIPPYSLTTLLTCLEAFGLEATLVPDLPVDPSPQQLPLLVVLKPEQPASPGGTEHIQDAPAEPTLGLIVRSEGNQVLWFLSGTETPRNEKYLELSQRLEPGCLSVRAKVPAANDPDMEEKPRFGFRWFIPELLKYKRLWREVVLASLAIQLLALAMPLFTQVVIDKVVVHQTRNTLLVIGIGLFMFMSFSAVLTWVRQYLVLHTGNRIDAALGSRVFNHLFALPIRYFEHRPTGTLVARLQGIETIREFVTGAAVTLFLDLPFLFIFLGLMFYYSWQLTLIVLALLGAVTVLSFGITPRLRSLLNEQFKLGARNQAFVTEYVSNVETVKSLQMEPQLRHRYGDFLASYLGASFATRNFSNTYNVAANTLEQYQTLAVLCVGAWLVMTTDGFTIGMLVAFQMFASRLAQPVLRMVGLWQQFQQADIAVKRLGDVMDAPTEPYAIQPVRAAGTVGRIDIEGLGFRYGDEHPFLYRNLNLSIAPGTTVALTGPSGSGKSTLTKLLQGFYLPTEGRIIIDGRDLRHLGANELRQYFGVVPQETALFSGTIYDNLILAQPHASFEQVIEACRLAEIHEAIEKLPQGYQTQLGEHGVGLSGGQKQRLAIARALLKRPKILIFDEATSNLDHATAEHLANTINQLKGKATVLFITHQMPKGLRVDEAVILGRQREAAKGRPSKGEDNG